MRKIALIFALVLWAGAAWAAEELMLINPGRETFVGFPTSSIGNEHVLTVFLPEDFVPLRGRYPLVVLFGAGPKQAQEAAAYVKKHSVIVAGIDLQEADFSEPEKVIQFVSQELIPYLDTNYATFPFPQKRLLAVYGEAASNVAIALLNMPELFGGISLVSPGKALTGKTLPSAGRIFITGNQAELASAQAALQKAGRTYGPDFALADLKNTNSLFEPVQADYFFSSDKESLALEKLIPSLENKTIQAGQPVSLKITARLKNKLELAYVPSSLRMSPPYLDWNPAEGTLRVLSGAVPGKIKIRADVDNPGFSVKIKYKK